LRKIITALTFMLLFFAAPLFAAQPTTFEQIWGPNGENWGVVAVTAVLLSILFVALAYMVGLAFRQAKLAIWAKNELYQALASAFILAFLMLFLSFLSPFVGELSELSQYSCSDLVGHAYTPGETSYHIECARKVLEVSKNALIKQADQIFNVNVRIQLLAALNKNFDIAPNPTLQAGSCLTSSPDTASLAFGLAVSPYAGVSMLGDAIGYMFPFLATWIASFIAQEFVLRMIQDALFPVLLALGLILRAFFFTRRLGGLLIAIALGLYTIYPLMYLLLMPQFLFTARDIWYDKWNPIVCYCDSSNQAINCPVRFCTPDLIPFVLFGVTLPHLGVDAPIPQALELEWLFILCNSIGRLMVPAFFLPVVIIIVTVAFVKGLSPLLGGDVEIAGLTHLI